MALLSVPPFESFYEEHRDAVLGELRRLLGRDRAEDAYQETFLKALRAYGALRNADNLRAWVLTIARRVAVDQLRRREAPPLEPEPPIEGRPAHAELGELADELLKGTRRGRASAMATTPSPPWSARAARARTPHGRRPRPVSADFEGGCNDRLPLSTVVSAKPRLRQGCSTLRTTSPTLRSGRSSRRPSAALQDLVRPQPDREADWLRLEHSAFVSSGRRSRSTPFAASWTSISQARARGSSCRSTFARPPRSVARSLKRLARVPHGEVTTYGALARAAGCPRAASGRNGDEPESDSDRAPLPPSRRCDRLARRRGEGSSKEQLLKLEGALGSSLLDM